MKPATILGAIMLAIVVLVVIATQKPHDSHGDVVVSIAAASPAPTPSVAPTVAPATPRPTPETWDVATGAMAHVAVIGWLVGLAILPLFALIGIALHARHRSRLTELDHPPLRRPEFVHRAFDVKSLEARRGWLPESFTYSPHMRNDAVDLVDEEEPAPTLTDLLTVQQALDMPGIVYGQRLDNGEPLVEQRVLSLAVGGRPGSGKTSTVVLLAAQYIRMGALVYVADPHSGHPDSLLSRLEPLMGRPQGDWRVAESPRETLHLVERVHDQLERRKSGWRRHNGDQRPLVAVVDEFAESLRLLPPGDRERLLELIQIIGYSGRKYGVATVLLAQSWLTGGVFTSQVRNPVQASITHAMRADEARALTGLRAEAWPSDPMGLPPGEAFALGIGSSGLLRIRVPLVEPLTRAHAPTRAALQMTSEPRPDDVPMTSNGDQIALPGRHSDVVSEASDAVPDATVDAILKSFSDGSGLSAAIRSVTGLRPGGRQYDAIRAAVEGALRAR